MKTIIAGSRRISNPRLVFGLLDQSKLEISEVISGLAFGVDMLGKEWAEQKGIPVLSFPVTKSDWQTYGKSAGMRRNKKMAEVGNALILIWDGQSSGSKNMKSLMAGRPIEEHVIEIPQPFISEQENNLNEFISKCCRKPLETTLYGKEGLLDTEVAFCEKCDAGYYLKRHVENFLWVGE